MTLKELEKKVQALEDLEEIKKLKVRYAKYIDDNFKVEKLGELFTEDAVWGGKRGGCSGEERQLKNTLPECQNTWYFRVTVSLRLISPLKATRHMALGTG